MFRRDCGDRQIYCGGHATLYRSSSECGRRPRRLLVQLKSSPRSPGLPCVAYPQGPYAFTIYLRSTYPRILQDLSIVTCPQVIGLAPDFYIGGRVENPQSDQTRYACNALHTNHFCDGNAANKQHRAEPLYTGVSELTVSNLD
jgi:hypothetical protein